MKEILEKSLLQKIERLEAFEDRMKIRIEKLQINMGEHGYFELFCEINPLVGTEISDNIKIECIIYDTTGGILNLQGKQIMKDDFFGFQILCFTVKFTEKIGKIRVYPRKN
jgi:hypothetical protein